MKRTFDFAQRLAFHSVLGVAGCAFLKATYQVKIRSTARGQNYEAELVDAGGQVKFNGQLFGSPSGAGQAAANWKSCNGWTFWKYLNEESGIWRPLQEIRSRKTAD